MEPPLQNYLLPLLQHVLARVLDSNKKVQEAACSAVSAIEENARDKLIPFLKDILNCLVQGFKIYHVCIIFVKY